MFKTLFISAAALAISVGLFFSTRGESTPDDVLTLSENNLVVLNVPITSESARDVQVALLEKNEALGPKQPIYLFLNSPGGSIDAGMSIVELIKGLPRPVYSVSLFSASMSFMLSQYLQKRYVTSNAVLMAHRATLGGVEGQIPGSFFSRANFILSSVTAIERTVADRAGITLEAYRDMAANELWIDGTEAVSLKFADKVVKVACDSSLQGAGATQTISAFMFTLKVTWHKCPLISTPIDVSMSGQVDKDAVEGILYHREKFLREYINTQRFLQTLKR